MYEGINNGGDKLLTGFTGRFLFYLRLNVKLR